MSPDAGVHVLPIPTPFAVGRVNAYLIDDDPLTLLDTGPNSGKALDELERALAGHGRRVEDLERIVVSHQHMDHLGLVAILARRSGAEVCALAALAPWMASYGARMEAEDRFADALMARHGIPEDVRLALGAVSMTFRGWGAAATADRLLHDGGTLDFAGRSLRVWHRPGHSASDTIFHDESSGALFGADHLLADISSNPLAGPPLEGEVAGLDRRQALVEYLASLTMTRAMDVASVLPGHGDPIVDHAALIDERMRLHERRATKLERLIAEQPRSAYELAQAMWGDVAVTQAFLTLSEVLGHTDLLLNDGRVREELEPGGVARFVSA